MSRASLKVVEMADSSVREAAPGARERQVRRAHHAAYMAALPPLGSGDTDTNKRVSALFQAGNDYAAYWERQFKRVDRILTSLLASDGLSEGARAATVGRRFGTRRDASLLTEHEAALVEAYRALAPAGRATLRQVIGWAVAEKPVGAR